MSVVDVISGASFLGAGTWSVDPRRSSVTFSVKHMLVAKMSGCFHEFDGKLRTGAELRAEGVVKAASIDTNESVRDEHLRRSPDFFDVERYPEIRFNSTRMDDIGGGRLRIVGELTMRGVTRETELHAQLKRSTGEPDGGERVALELSGELDRRDFGLTWNEKLDAGGALLGNKVKVALKISAVKVRDCRAVAPGAVGLTSLGSR